MVRWMDSLFLLNAVISVNNWQAMALIKWHAVYAVMPWDPSDPTREFLAIQVHAGNFFCLDLWRKFDIWAVGGSELNTRRHSTVSVELEPKSGKIYLNGCLLFNDIMTICFYDVFHRPVGTFINPYIYKPTELLLNSDFPGSVPFQ